MDPVQSSDINSNGGTTNTFNVFVEGNIASGKSTFLQQCEGSEDDFELIPEPLGKWSNVGGVNLLSEFYGNPTAWAFRLQSYITLSMVESYLKPTARPAKIIERSLWSARNCFVEQMLDDGVLNRAEYAILEEWYEHIDRQHKIRPDLIVYLRTEPTTAFNRMTGRGRAAEANVTLEYLKAIHQKHEDWIFEMEAEGIPVTTIDADQSLEELEMAYIECRSDIMWAAHPSNRS